MSHLHFTATNEYKKRVIQMGEIPKNVYCVGGLGVDNIKATSLYTKSALEKKLNITKEDIGSKISVDDYNRECKETVMMYKDSDCISTPI